MSRNIKTLWDTQESNNEQTPNPGQAFYAGGSEHSGQQILGPSRDGLVEDLFNHAQRSAATASSDRPIPGATTLPIVFWRNGFTVGDNTTLRDYNSNDNRQFLECLRRGETPPELSSQVRGGMIDVKLENKANQDYKPEHKFKAFSGEGHRLGAP